MSRWLGRLALCAPLWLCVGFEWPGQVYRIQHELRRAEPQQRRELVRKLGQYSAESVKETLLLALEDSDANVRLEAAEAAGRVRLREAVPILLDWIDDKEADTRRSAAAALGRIGEARALPALVRALGDSSGEVRRAAVIALGRMAPALGGAGEPAATDAIVPLLGRLEDTDLAVRSEAMRALASLGDARAVVPLLGVAADPAVEVRAAALAALGQIGDARALPALTRALADDSDDVRIAAAAALGRLGDAGAVRALKAALDHAEPRCAAAIVAALGSIDSDDARALLLAQLEAGALQQAATRSLVEQARRHAQRIDVPNDITPPRSAGAMPPTEAQRSAGAMPLAETSAAQPNVHVALVTQLAGALRGASSEAHKLAFAETVAELAELGPIDAAVPVLLATLPNAHGELANTLMRALGMSAAPDALMPLLERLGQAESGLLAPALQALQAYFERAEPDGRAADPLLARLPEASARERVALVDLLARVRAPRTLPSLLGLLGHDDVELRVAALRAIAAIGGVTSEAAEALLPLLDASDARTRFEAARALGASASRASVRVLLTRLAADATQDRHALLIALGAALPRLAQQKQLTAADSKLALESLTTIYDGDDDELADRAAYALAAWGPKDALARLASGLRAPSSRRRAAASRALGQLSDPAARQVLRYVLSHGASREATAAAAALGELGDQRDIAALAKLIKRLHWPTPGAAAYALSRIAQRGVLKPHLAARSLCELGRSREPYVRANIAAALAALGAAACEDRGPDPLRWLGSQHAAIVRAAAARWLYAAARAGRIDAARAEHALQRCQAEDVEADVREACAAPALPRSYEPTELYAYASDGVSLLRNALVGVHFADGSAWLGYSDNNAQVRLKAAPLGKLVLADPSLTLLDPVEPQ